jgi:hypothetical protein
VCECPKCKDKPNHVEDFKNQTAIMFLILSPFIGIMIACFIFAIFG